MRGSELSGLRRWTSTPAAAGDLFKSSPRSGALRTGAAWPPASGTEVAVPATVLVSARGAVVVPRLAADGGRPAGAATSGASGAGVAPESVGGAVPGVVGGGWVGGG